MTRTVTRPRHAPHAPRVPFALLILGLLAGGMCALLALNTASAANEVRRHDIAAADQSVAAQLVQLNNDEQASAAPGNLAAAAGALGMVPAGNPAFLEIGADGSVRVLGSPAAASAPPMFVPKPTTSKTTKPKKAPKKTTKKTGKKTSKKSTSKTTKAATTTAKPPPAKHPTEHPTPTPTPTPESTLPGGAR